MNKDLRDKIITKVVGGLVIVSLAVILATLQMELFPNVDWSEVDTTPLYWPETFPPDPEPDWEDSDEWHEIWYNEIDTNSNGEDDSLEYHGKEGKSEYGEYDSN